GKTILDTDVNKVTDPAKITHHPGMFRDRGHLGFLGHNDYIEFRNIRIKELPTVEKDNTPPEGFTALFNGHDLTNWKGLLAGPNDNPAKRAKLSPEQLQKAQAEADDSMRKHWKVADGALEFDGKGRSLATVKDYGNFEMLVDWKILPKGDSGIYLRGSPQVQIWDATDTGNKRNKLGSGGLFNNQKAPADPVKMADKPVGEWNRFRIVMVGEKVHVFLNNELVVNNTTLENYWERDKPIYPTGQIELQNHGNNLWFKNIYIRELPGI
ncbi:MAG TPA: family 16 glycoside hydrolase, partial [Verrucomicrobiae bacterium]|nr:family 16 glycoside hydrolase [Verrucomicrobiae bacterium]